MRTTITIIAIVIALIPLRVSADTTLRSDEEFLLAGIQHIAQMNSKDEYRDFVQFLIDSPKGGPWHHKLMSLVVDLGLRDELTKYAGDLMSQYTIEHYGGGGMG